MTYFANFKFGGMYFLKLCPILWTPCICGRGSHALSIHKICTEISLKPIHSFGEINLLLVPQVRNSITQLSLDYWNIPICIYFNKLLQQGRLCLISEKNGLLVVALILVWNLKYYQAMFWLSIVATHLDLYSMTNLNEYRYVTGKTLPDEKKF